MCPRDIGRYRREEVKPKTAFVCHAGTYQYSRMPVGLTNAPTTFQRAVDMIIAKFTWQTCLVYIDDVIVYSNSTEERIKHVDQILTVLLEAGVTL